MFRKPLTVASVMQSLIKAIKDLDIIIQNSTIQTNTLISKRAAISARIEDLDLEIHQATGVADRLQNLIGEDVPS